MWDVLWDGVREAYSEPGRRLDPAVTGFCGSGPIVRRFGTEFTTMDGKQRRAELRGAVNRADGSTIVQLADGWLGSDEALQLLGDGLLAALAQQIAGASEQAVDCAGRLRGRGWEGDDDLAGQLDAARGATSEPQLRPLPIDVEELAMLLEGDDLGAGGRIDRKTGDVWHESAIEYALEVGEEDEDSLEDGDRWLWVDCEGSAEGYRDIQAFIATISDPSRADRLEIAIQGRGAFRRFKDVLARWPDELERWFAFSEDRQRGRARAWLAQAGYSPVPRRSP